MNNNKLREADGLYKERASDDSNPLFNQSMNIDRIPTAIEYSSSSSIDVPFGNDDCQSRYSVPMEIGQIEEQELDVCDNYDAENDFIPDKYSIVVDEFDEDNCDDITFGSLDNDSFISDTALWDEVQNEREQIKKTFILTNKISKETKPLFDFTTCFGPTSIYSNLR
jgi:hypothetical protein